MRLGLLLPPLGGRAAGLAVYVEQVASRLLTAHPDWVVFRDEPDAPPAFCHGHPTVGLAGRGLAAAGRRVHPRLGRLLALQGALRGELARRAVDALLVPFHDGVLGCPVPQAIVVHDLTLLRHPPARSLAARLYMRQIFRRVARRASLLIAVSQATAADLQGTWAIPAARLRVVHEGFDRALFRPFSADEIAAVAGRLGVPRPYLFYAGTCARHKNLELVIDALAQLAERAPELRLVVAGPRLASDFERLAARARERGVGERLVALGYVERRDLGPLMAGATAFVFPSLAEGFGLAPLEAMASGAAVLAADAASLPEVVGDGGRLLDPRDPRPWRDAIHELRADPAADRELRRRAVERSRRFDWDRAAGEILALLLQLAERPRRQRRGP